VNPWLGLSAGLLLIFLTGFCILDLLGYDRKDLPRRPYLAFCYGSGSTSLFMFLSALAHVRLSLGNNLVFVGALLALCIAKGFMGDNRKPRWSLFQVWEVKERGCSGRYQKWLCSLLVLLIAIQIGYLSSRSLLEPETSFDGRVRWGLCAKSIYADRSLYTEYFNNPKDSYNLPFNPLLVPLQMTSMYFAMGGMHARLVKVVFVVYFLMLMAAFYDVAKRYVSVSEALLFTCFLATCPPYFYGEGSASTCMADVPLAFFCFMCVVLLLRLVKQTQGAMIVPVAMVAFFCAFTKSEGAYYALIVMFSWLVAAILDKDFPRREVVRCAVAMAAIFILLYMPWAVFRMSYIQLDHPNVPDGLTMGYVFSKVHRLTFIIPKLIEECLMLYRWHVIWLVFVVSLVCVSRRAFHDKSVVFLLGTIFGFFSFWTLTYMLSAWWGRLDDQACRELMDVTLFRLYLHLIPTVVLCSIACLRQDGKGNLINRAAPGP
jgi:hypothetical protein